MAHELIALPLVFFTVTETSMPEPQLFTIVCVTESTLLAGVSEGVAVGVGTGVGVAVGVATGVGVGVGVTVGFGVAVGTGVGEGVEPPEVVRVKFARSDGAGEATKPISMDAPGAMDAFQLAGATT